MTSRYRPKPKGLHPSPSRWIHVAVWSLLLSVAWILIFPLAWGLAEHWLSSYDSGFKQIVFWLGVCFVFYLAAEPIRLRSKQWRGLMLYAPLWLAVPFSLLLAGALLKWHSFRLPLNGLERQNLACMLWIAAGLAVVMVFVRQFPWFLRRRMSLVHQGTDSRNDKTGLSNRPTPLKIKEWLDSGERPRRRHEEDLFEHRRLSSRITHEIGDAGRSVALLG